MTTQVLRGTVEPLALIDVLAYLGRSKASGALRVTCGSIEKSLIISEGMIVFARSNQMEDRLGDMLLARGMITQEKYDQASSIIYERAIRHGRALVEVGAITPKQLWETIQEQIRGIACSVTTWEQGSYEFFKQDIRKKESITLQWPIFDMITDVIRNLEDVALFKTRFTDPQELLIHEHPAPVDSKLEPYELHVLHFIDGQTHISEICERSDFGAPETLRVLYLLKSLGWIKSEPRIPDLIETHPLVEGFNCIYAFVHEYLSERVGAVGTNLLRKYFEDTRAEHPEIFEGVSLTEKGTLHGGQVQRNLDKLDLEDHETMMVVDDALNEYLNICILAVTRLLGSEHETLVIEKIGEMM